jgi:hypothetical protein
MKTNDTFCPICKNGNNKSENIRVCVSCQLEFMPEGEDSDSEPIEYPSIGCYDGFITI